MNAATRAASISAVSRAGAGGCLVVLAAARSAAARRTSPRTASAWSRGSTPGTWRSCGRPTRYAVGDVVAYRSVSLNTVVMHRIVAMDGDRLRDPGRQQRLARRGPPDAGRGPRHALPPHPAGRQGARRAHAPRRARVARGRRRSPLVGARAPAARPARPPRRGAARPARPAPTFSDADPGAAPGRWRSAPAPSPCVAAVGGGVLLALPSTQTETTTLQVTQQGQFSYTGTAEPGTTYPDGRRLDRRHRLDQARQRPDRLLHEHRQRPRPRRPARRHAARRRRSPRPTAGAPT